MSARFVVGVGGQKCASTSIADYLKANGVAIHPRKELHAFNARTAPLSREEYLSKFPPLPQDGWFGEFTPNYCSHADALLNLQRMFPDAKVIFSYRNPITRLQSAYRHAVAVRQIPHTLTINEAIDQSMQGNSNHWVDTLVKFGQFDVMLQMVERIFGAQNVHVVRYEDLNSDAEPAALAALMRMLDIEFDPSISLKHLNTAAYQAHRSRHLADVTISPENLARLQEFFAPVESFMRSRGYRTQWF